MIMHVGVHVCVFFKYDFNVLIKIYIIHYTDMTIYLNNQLITNHLLLLNHWYCTNVHKL